MTFFSGLIQNFEKTWGIITDWVTRDGMSNEKSLFKFLLRGWSVGYYISKPMELQNSPTSTSFWDSIHRDSVCRTRLVDSLAVQIPHEAEEWRQSSGDALHFENRDIQVFFPLKRNSGVKKGHFCMKFYSWNTHESLNKSRRKMATFLYKISR